MKKSRPLNQIWGLAISMLAVLFLLPTLSLADSSENRNSATKSDATDSQSAKPGAGTFVESLTEQLRDAAIGLQNHLRQIAPNVQSMYRDSIVEISGEWKPMAPPVRDLKPFSGQAPFRDLVYGPQTPAWWSELRDDLSSWNLNFSSNRAVPRSGVIVSADGLIVTSNRAVQSTAFPRVRLPDGRRFPARVIGQDDDTGLALLKIDAAGLKTVAFESPLIQGGSELAVRSGVDQVTVLSWKTSGKYERGKPLAETRLSVLSSPADGDGLLQFREPLSASVEGGLVMNSLGVPLGIVTTPRTGIGVLAGSSFAQPLSTVSRTLAELKSEAPVEYLRLGLRLDQASDIEIGLNEVIDELPELNITPRVASVEPGSLADQAGIREGDVIVWMNDQPVSNAEEFQNALSEQPDVTNLEFGISRDARTVVLQVSPKRRIDNRLSGAPARALY